MGAVRQAAPHPMGTEMDDANEATSPPLDVRTEPVQRRSIERIDLLLDTAAAVIDERGIDGLSTSDIAALSRSSVGVVYRYFPNIDSLLLALAGRNMDRYLARVQERVAGADARDWRTFIRESIEAYADLARSEPGFRVIRFGDLVALRFRELESASNVRLAHRFGTMLVDEFGFTGGEAFERELETVIEIADALTRRAFQRDPAGEAAFMERTLQLAVDLLAPFAPEGTP